MTGAQGLRYAEGEPAPALAAHVLAYWSFSAGPAVAPHAHVVWPDGCPSLLVATGAPAPVVFGPRTRPYETPTRAGMRVWGLRFWPDVGPVILGATGRALRDVTRPAPAFSDLRDALQGVEDQESAWNRIEAWCLARVGEWPMPEPRVRRAIGMIAATSGLIAMDELAEAAGASLRNLQRLFREATGLTLKEYARIRRFRAALAPRLANPEASWSETAAAHGYADHAHLTREFRALSGASPSRLAARIAEIRHENVKP
jgi:AraC-like DNA-binding protein